jgi:hypothetical protein
MVAVAAVVHTLVANRLALAAVVTGSFSLWEGGPRLVADPAVVWPAEVTAR